MIDLHTHSTFSDGSDRPAALARRAAEVGLRAIALTDHDSTAGAEEMTRACAEEGVELVMGVEVSLRDELLVKSRPDGTVGPRNVHVLGYFVPTDPGHPLQARLAELRYDRDVRNEALVRALVERGFTRISLDYLAELAGNVHSVGRPHFARAMFELHPEIVGERTPETWNRVFAEWLGSAGRAYVPKASMTIEHFLEATAGSGVVVSVAHPLDNYVDDGDDPATVLPAVFASLRERGVHGVEAHYGSYDAATRASVAALARATGLIPTGGSDYHGSYKSDVRLGRGRVGDLQVPDEVLDELRAARDAVH